MKRRAFLRSLSASAAVPALPLGQAASAVASPTPAPIAAAVYGRAVHLARLWSATVPEMFTGALNLDPDQAERVFNELVRHNVLGAPNASGIARASAPYLSGTAAGRFVAGGKPVAPTVQKTPSLDLTNLDTTGDQPAQAAQDTQPEDDDATQDRTRDRQIPPTADHDPRNASASCNTDKTASAGTSPVTKA